MRYKTLEDVKRAQNVNYKGSVPYEEFFPMEVKEWKEYSGKSIPHKALTESGAEVEYIRKDDGALIDVGLKVTNKNGSTSIISFMAKVDEDKHMSPINVEAALLEFEEWLKRCWDYKPPVKQIDQEEIDQELYDQQNLTLDEYTKRYPEE